MIGAVGRGQLILRCLCAGCSYVRLAGCGWLAGCCSAKVMHDKTLLSACVACERRAACPDCVLLHQQGDDSDGTSTDLEPQTRTPSGTAFYCDQALCQRKAGR
jgi:hypothetical protein